MSSNVELNNKIKKIWNDYPNEEHTKYRPILYPPFKKNGILFFGLNPSLTKDIKSALKDTDYANLDPHKDFKLNSRLSDEDIVQIEINCIDKYAYFKKLERIAIENKLPFYHLDLFFHRKTKQKEFKKIHNLNKKKNLKILDNMSKFLTNQMNLSLSMIEEINPRIIVLNNAFASDIFKENFQLDERFDEEIGTYKIQVNGRAVPVLLSGMMGGQRALDNHTYERLRWQIRRILSKPAT